MHGSRLTELFCCGTCHLDTPGKVEVGGHDLRTGGNTVGALVLLLSSTDMHLGNIFRHIAAMQTIRQQFLDCIVNEFSIL